MHIPDGVLSLPVCAATGAVTLGAVGYSLHKLKDSLAERTIPLTGMMSALLFAGQMVNFPIGLLGIPSVSGHLLGGVLASAVLGPWAGCLAVTLVLAVQCALFSDGGLLALGANVLNMGVVGALGGYAVYAAARKLLGGGSRATVVGVVIASWVSVMAAAALFCLELRLSHSGVEYDFSNVFALMVIVHSAIGVGEAMISGGVVSFVLSQRPDLIYQGIPRPGLVGYFGRATAAGVVVALAIAVFLAPFASAAPDGLEAVGETTGFTSAVAEPTVPALNGYAIPAPVVNWEDAPAWQKISVSLAGLTGTVMVLVIALVLGGALKRLASTAGPSHAK